MIKMTKTKNKKEEKNDSLKAWIGIIILLSIMIGSVWFYVANFGWNGDADDYVRKQCEKDLPDNTEELYCKFTHESYNGNPNYRIVNRTQEKEFSLKLQNRFQKEKECYQAGTDFKQNFSLVEDYNITCEKIKYLNDHFLLTSSKKESGTVSQYRSGLFSSYSTETKLHQWVYDEVLATGNLPKYVSYHLDCNNNTKNPVVIGYDGHCIYSPYSCQEIKYQETKVIKYYSEADFIMHYAHNCIEVDA